MGGPRYAERAILAAVLVPRCVPVIPGRLVVAVVRTMSDRGPLARCGGLPDGHRELEEDCLRHDGEDGEPDDRPRYLRARGATPRSCGPRHHHTRDNPGSAACPQAGNHAAEKNIKVMAVWVTGVSWPGAGRAVVACRREQRGDWPAPGRTGGAGAALARGGGTGRGGGRPGRGVCHRGRFRYLAKLQAATKARTRLEAVEVEGGTF